MRWWVHAWPEACTRLAASGHRAGGFTSGSGWALVGRALYMAAHVTGRCSAVSSKASHESDPRASKHKNRRPGAQNRSPRRQWSRQCVRVGTLRSSSRVERPCTRPVGTHELVVLGVKAQQQAPQHQELNGTLALLASLTRLGRRGVAIGRHATVQPRECRARFARGKGRLLHSLTLEALQAQHAPASTASPPAAPVAASVLEARVAAVLQLVALPGLGHPSAQESRRLVDRAKRPGVQRTEPHTRVASGKLHEDARFTRPHQQQARLAGDQLDRELVQLREESGAHLERHLEGCVCTELTLRRERVTHREEGVGLRDVRREQQRQQHAH
eukprot:scaffold18586_cov59-Phaeocystis_antarctica.AAC.2